MKGPLKLVLGVWIGLILEQHCEHLSIAKTYGSEQQSSAIHALGVDISAPERGLWIIGSCLSSDNTKGRAI